MKISTRVLIVSITIGIFVWVLDALVDHLFFSMRIQDVFSDNTYWAHEMYMRTALSVAFILFGAILSLLMEKQKATERKLKASLSFQQTLIDAIPIPIFYKNENLIYTGCNRRFATFLGKPMEAIIGKNVYDLAPRKLADTYHQKDLELLRNPGIQVYEYEVDASDGGRRMVIFNKATFFRPAGEIGGMIGAILDITERKQAEHEKDRLIGRLQAALDKVKVLSGLIPICASCKKIRDDKGFWNQLENYISTHSDAIFSHGICPDCTQKLYPQYAHKHTGPGHK